MFHCNMLNNTGSDGNRKCMHVDMWLQGSGDLHAVEDSDGRHAAHHGVA